MGLESQEIADRNRWHRAMNMALILMLFGLLALGVTSFYCYAQDQLYRESIAQLKEIAGQIYEKLEIELDYQWSYLERMDENQRDTKNMRLQEFTEYIDSAQSLLSPADDALDLIAVDEQGFFYDAHGRQGLWSCVDHLTDRERSSFLTSYWSGGKTMWHLPAGSVTLRRSLDIRSGIMCFCSRSRRLLRCFGAVVFRVPTPPM